MAMNQQQIYAEALRRAGIMTSATPLTLPGFPETFEGYQRIIALPDGIASLKRMTSHSQLARFEAEMHNIKRVQRHMGSVKAEKRLLHEEYNALSPDEIELFKAFKIEKEAAEARKAEAEAEAFKAFMAFKEKEEQRKKAVREREEEIRKAMEGAAFKAFKEAEEAKKREKEAAEARKAAEEAAEEAASRESEKEAAIRLFREILATAAQSWYSNSEIQILHAGKTMKESGPGSLGWPHAVLTMWREKRYKGKIEWVNMGFTVPFPNDRRETDGWPIADQADAEARKLLNEEWKAYLNFCLRYAERKEGSN
jgi:hypothetical protein